MPLNKLSMGNQTWFFKDPLSAVVTVNERGEIKIEGQQTEYIYGVVNPNNSNPPYISSASFKMN